MKKLILFLILIFCLTIGAVLAEENKGEEKQPPPKSIEDETKKDEDCEKKCVQRDGYGRCIKFETVCK